MTNIVNFAEFRRFSTTVLVGSMAIAVTAAWSAGVDVTPLFEDAWIRRGELWRLLTSAFPHVNAAHLLFNLYWLWEFGKPIEHVFGHAKTALFLVLFAVGSAAFEFALASGGVGLSGVVYGQLGLLWVLSRRDDRFRNAISRTIIWLFVAWFALCVVLSVKNIFIVANIAHAVGFVTGVLLGMALTLRGRKQVLSMGTVCALLLISIWAATIGRPMVNLSSEGGNEEEMWGYEALRTGHDREAVRWLRDATRYHPETAGIWASLGLAYQRVGDEQEAKEATQRWRQLKSRSSKTMNEQRDN
jgi:membrane associated rhomboid family serine protease